MSYHNSSGQTATNTADLLSKLNTFVVTTVGWTLHDDQSAASPAYYVWKSTGESGTEEIYVRATYGTTDGIVFTTYRYWDNSSQTGYGPSPTYGVITYSIWADHDASFIYWLYGDLDKIVVVTKTTVGRCVGGFGVLTSVWSRSFATTSEVVAGAGANTINVDDASIFTVNKYYGIVNTNDVSGAYEKIQITAVDTVSTPNTITATFAGAHPIGAVIGEDPRPNYVMRYATNQINICGPTGTLTTNYSMAVASQFTAITSGDPDARQGWTWLFPCLIYQITDQEYRGSIPDMFLTGGANIGEEDTITVGSTIYKCFDASNATGTSQYGWLAIKQE